MSKKVQKQECPFVLLERQRNKKTWDNADIAALLDEFSKQIREGKIDVRFFEHRSANLLGDCTFEMKYRFDRKVSNCWSGRVNDEQN